MKCKGTSKEEASINRSKRELVVTDKRVIKCFCQYELESEDPEGVGVVLLDRAYAEDHVRHCLNSTKTAKV